MSMRHDRRTFLKHAIGAASAGLAVPLFAACAPTSTASPTPQPQAQANAPTTAPAAGTSVTKVSYACASLNGLHLVATVGGEKPDLTHKFGIEFDVLTTTNAPNAVNALMGGSVNTAGVTPDSAWPAQDKAPDAKQLIAVADGTPYVVLAQPEIKKAADLKGKTLGVSALNGGADLTALRVMLSEAGLTQSDYTLVQAGAISDRTAAMKAKSIAAVANLEPQASLLRDSGFPELDNGNNYPALKGVHAIVLLAKTGWYQGNPELVANFLRSWDAITTWIYDPANKAELLALAKKAMGGTDAGAEGMYTLHVTAKSVSQNLRINEKFLQQFIENQKKAGIENLPTDVTKYVDNSLVARVLNV
jgi:ABC-type nitrate/sulfonate/bicarbonate transport system substrate-binding protein